MTGVVLPKDAVYRESKANFSPHFRFDHYYFHVNNLLYISLKVVINDERERMFLCLISVLPQKSTVTRDPVLSDTST